MIGAAASGSVSFIGAACFVALAVAAACGRTNFGRWPYVTALLGTAAWLAIEGLFGTERLSSWFSEAMRNLGWLWFMASIAGHRVGARRIGGVGWIYIGLFAIEAVMAAVMFTLAVTGRPLYGMLPAVASLQMLFAAGALVLLHNLIDAGRADERRVLTLPLAALAGMWTYDLNLFAISYLSRAPAELLLVLRPVASLIVAALLGVAAMQASGQAVKLSRPVAFRSLALAAVLGWLALLSLLAVVLDGAGGNDFGTRAQIGVLAATLAVAALMFASPALRARVRVWIAKHFFEHRYDYRAEWLRFTGTLNRPEAGGHSLDARVVKAIADIVESGGGVLLTNDGAEHYAVAAQWQASALALPADADWSRFVDWLGSSGRIVQFDEVRAGQAPADEVAAMPAGLLDAAGLWIAVPLIHLERVEGVVLLAHPPLTRALDWEDYDLLKVAGRQAASHLAEARGAEALAESVRFEEFHRRFAFVMHDVKNLASQLAVLSRNVERHGDNPDFREDMVETLKLSAERLGQLTQRLSQQEKVRVERLSAVDVGHVAARVAASKRSIHAVEVTGGASEALADGATLGQLLVHLVQNAIDATPGDAPVTIALGEGAGHITVTVTDRGVGMSPEFVRTGLFRPFVSTKDGGFGIGAYQARQLAMAMGGTLAVDSREGAGTSFILTLPRAESAADDHDTPDSPQESRAA